MSITAKLRDDHDHIMRLAAVLRVMIAQPVPPPGIDLVNFRTEFSRQLLAHLSREDWLLYPSLLQTSDRRIAATAQAFIDEMGGLQAAYKSWSARWPTERIHAEWASFVSETTDLLDVMEKRIERENTELYPLVEHDRLHGSLIGLKRAG